MKNLFEAFTQTKIIIQIVIFPLTCKFFTQFWSYDRFTLCIIYVITSKLYFIQTQQQPL